MTDYYAELGLDRSLTLEELNSELSRTESKWKARRTKAPEKATRVLGLIYEAREAFATEASRAEYDRKLDTEESRSQGDGQGDSSKSDFAYWRARTAEYSDVGKTDLALAALARALDAPGSQTADASFYTLASSVYLQARDYDRALSSSNEAILLNPSYSFAYYQKGLVHLERSKDRMAAGELGEALSDIKEGRDLLVEASEVAKDEGNESVLAKALGSLALSLWAQTPKDEEAALQYARVSASIDGGSRHAQIVLEGARAKADVAQEKRSARERMTPLYLLASQNLPDFDDVALILAKIEDGLSVDSIKGDLPEMLRYSEAIEKTLIYSELTNKGVNFRGDLNHELAPYFRAKREAEKAEKAAKGDAPSGGCYVATAVYGSYDCPEVWRLRRFRDERLAKSVPGRTFIRIYYALSPGLVRRFGRSGWFHAATKPLVSKLERRLARQGVSDAPYEDKPWATDC